MKKVLFALALAASCSLAFANGNGNGNGNGNNGGASIGGSGTIYGGTVTGGVTSINHGEATAATFISGQGFSNQWTSGNVTGSAFAGGTVSSSGVLVNTVTTQKVDFASNGNIGGGAQAMNAGSQILNGTTGYGTIENDAVAVGTFNKASIGGFVGISGSTFGHFPGF